jgi:hypothetical protein
LNDEEGIYEEKIVFGGIRRYVRGNDFRFNRRSANKGREFSPFKTR